jgi:hypothetical protein
MLFAMIRHHKPNRRSANIRPQSAGENRLGPGAG